MHTSFPAAAATAVASPLVRAVALAFAGVATPALAATAPAPPAGASAVATSPPPGDGLGEVVVTAGFRPRPADAVPASVAVLDADTLRAAGTQHFADVLGLVPNLNWSAGSSRPRYFQVRGIGELEQYEGAPNPSVGLLVDDVDFSGLGMVATLYDIDRIEVLRGPQGTRYGANALGGLVYVRSRAPEATFDAGTTVGAGDRGARSLGAYATGPVAALDSAVRLAVQRYRADGPSRNAFLGADTNARDETTARLRWRWTPSPGFAADLAVLHARLDNGYDAFAIDNSRTTLSDRPGEDSQSATGASLRGEWADVGGATLTLVAAAADSDSVHAYDGDWGNARSWAPYTYDFAYRADRERRTRTLEARLASPGSVAPVLGADPADEGDGRGWLVGAWYQDLRETIAETSGGTLGGPGFEPPFVADDALASRYRAESAAAFGQLDGALAPRLAWSLGLRVERREARYDDARTSAGAPTGAAAFRPTDTMGGGHASLTWRHAEHASLYAQLSRGYRAGGFNPSGALPEARRLFGPEALWNAEVGWRAASADGRLRAEATLFHMRREDLQVRTGEQLVPGDPNTFVFYTGNAARGFNRGLEASLRWRPSARLDLGAALGLLDTRLRGFAIDGVPVPDRAQPHAPRWQAAVDATARAANGAFLRVDVTATAGYWFDVPPNDTRTGGWALAHVRGGVDRGRWAASAYVRNVFDREYPVRGFYFGNEPPDFPDRLYVQLGAPREWGVQFEYRHR